MYCDIGDYFVQIVGVYIRNGYFDGCIKRNIIF